MIIGEDGIRHEEDEAIKAVYQQYYQELLKTKEATCTEERNAEECVEIVMSSLHKIWEVTSWSFPNELMQPLMNSAIKRLKKRKAVDEAKWRNEFILIGGEPVKEGLGILFKMMYNQKTIPSVWELTRIKSIAKDHTKRIDHRRGLFITNIIGKIFERLIKERNQEEGNMLTMSPFQCGGVKGRSTVDNVFTLIAIIQRNQYLGLSTYCVFIDLTKCFDKLWLEDCLVELMKAGMNIDDVKMVYEMNKVAKVVVDTPVGDTDQFEVRDTVKQGTIFGPVMCGLSTGRINEINERVVTMYGPEVEIEPLVYVDDMNNGGDKPNSEKIYVIVEVLNYKKRQRLI